MIPVILQTIPRPGVRTLTRFCSIAELWRYSTTLWLLSPQAVDRQEDDQYEQDKYTNACTNDDGQRDVVARRGTGG